MPPGDLLPISVIKGKGFKELTIVHIKKHFEDKKDELKVKLALTTECSCHK